MTRRVSRGSEVLFSICILLLSLGSVSLAAAQDATPLPVHWSLEVPKHLAAVGKTPVQFEAHLRASVDEGWHIYSTTQSAGGPTKTTIDVPEGQPFYLIREVEFPQPQRDYDGNFNMTTEFYTHGVDFVLPLEVQPGTAAGPATLKVSVQYMTCNDRFCLPAKTVLATANVMVPASAASPADGKKVGLAPAVPQAAAVTKKPGTASTPDAPAAQGAAAASSAGPTAVPAKAAAAPSPPAVPAKLTTKTGNHGTPAGLIWLALSMGLLSTLTPCVFPLVPITLSYFSQRPHASAGGRVRDASLFAVGIIGTFTVLGLAVTAFAGASGVNRFAANPWVNLVMAAAFAGFALSLFGRIELRLPHTLTNRVDHLARSRAEQSIGVLLMGLAFALTSFTCTAPFIGSLLVMAAEGDWLSPTIGMALYAFAFSLPFVVIAAVPSLLQRLPRSGVWMQRLKVVMGFLELGAALKFAVNADMVWGHHLIARDVCLAVWASLSLLAAFYLLRIFSLEEEAPQSTGLLEMLAAAAFLAAFLLFASGVLGRRLPAIDPYLPTEETESTGARAPQQLGVSWLTNDYPGALAAAQAQHKLIFVDFTGYTCTNCRWMEANIFPQKDVAEEMGHFINVHLYTDAPGAVFEQQQELEERLVRTVALPYYVILGPSGKLIGSFPGLTHSEDEFLKFLKRAEKNPNPKGGD